jgi:hypothetical protein
MGHGPGTRSARGAGWRAPLPGRLASGILFPGAAPAGAAGGLEMLSVSPQAAALIRERRGPVYLEAPSAFRAG